MLVYPQQNGLSYCQLKEAGSRLFLEQLLNTRFGKFEEWFTFKSSLTLKIWLSNIKNQNLTFKF